VKPVYLDPEDPARVVLDVPDRELELARLVPGSRWDKDRKVFTLPLSWATWMALQGVFGAELEVGDDFGQWTRDEYARRVGPCLAVRHAVDVADPENFDPRLRPFQRPGVAMLACAGQMVLADDVGCGKTVQAILGLRRLADAGHEVFPVVVVAPKSVLHQWADEWAIWWPEPEVRVVDGSATKRRRQLEPGADVYVLGWGSVRYHSRLAPYGSIFLKKCGEHPHGDDELKPALCEVHEKELNVLGARSVVVDEAHRMKNVKAKQTRATWAVQHGPTVRYRFALTGTPVADHPGDLWPLLHGVAPEEYPRRVDFLDRYCLQSWSLFGGLAVIGLNPTTRDEFLGFFDPRFRRVPKELVLPDLPPVQYVTREAELSPKQLRAYRELEEQHFTRDEAGHLLLTSNPLTEQLRLLQYASATCEVDAAGEVQLADPSPKLDVLVEVLEDTERPVVVAAQSRKLVDLAAKRLDKLKLPYGMLVGGMTADQRGSVLRDLREGRTRVLLFTVQAGGEGVNMTEADTLVRLDRSWSMLLNRQTVGRVHRIGSEQHASVTVIDVVAPRTVEQRQLATLRRKEARLEEITRDKATLLAAVPDGATGAELDELEAEERAILGSDLTSEEDDP